MEIEESVMVAVKDADVVESTVTQTLSSTKSSFFKAMLYKRELGGLRD